MRCSHSQSAASHSLPPRQERTLAYRLLQPIMAVARHLQAFCLIGSF